VTLTCNEILHALNTPEQYILALVEIDDEGCPYEPRYVWQPPFEEPGFGVTSVNYNMDELLAMSEEPR
jgi:hypothetical protein